MVGKAVVSILVVAFATATASEEINSVDDRGASMTSGEGATEIVNAIQNGALPGPENSGEGDEELHLGGEACCMPDGTCIDTDPATCISQGGFPQGPFSSCATELCLEACCSSDGTCSDMVSEICEAVGGFPRGPFSTCATGFCLEACCLPDESCNDLVPEICEAVGGFPRGAFSSCDNQVCVEACCLPSGTCEDFVPEICLVLGGYPQGAFSSCANQACVEACCMGDGACDDLVPEICLVFGGYPQGAFSSCAANECLQACCMALGDCVDLVPEICAVSDGFPQGPGSSCDTNVCLQACCFEAGNCVDLLPGICAVNDGFPQGPGSSCDTNVCLQACCFEDETCVDLLPGICAANGGLPRGTGTACGGVICAPPIIVHATGQPGETRQCSGYIDPRSESSDGVNMNEGVDQVTLVFTEAVFHVGGGQVGPSDFIVTQTGGAAPPTVAAVHAADNPIIVVTLSRIITLQEWTTVRAVVQNAAGTLIPDLGNLGPGVDEPDRLDIGFLPCDVNQDGECDPFDLLRFRQYVNEVEEPECGILEDYLDIDRDQEVTPFDVLRFRQLVNGVLPSTRAWAGETMNNPRP